MISCISNDEKKIGWKIDIFPIKKQDAEAYTFHNRNSLSL